MPNRTLTPLDVFMARLIELGGDGVRLGETGFRLTVSPIQLHTEDAYKQCASANIPAAGLVRILAQLGITPDQLTALTAPAVRTGTEAA